MTTLLSVLVAKDGGSAEAGLGATPSRMAKTSSARAVGIATVVPKRNAPGSLLLPTWGEATTDARSRRPLSHDSKFDPKLRPTTSADPKIPVVVTPPVVPPPVQTFPVDLTTALRLAEVENPEIAEARQRILEATALRQAAYALMLPTLNGGLSYHGHDGNLQRSAGHTLAVSQQAVYVGGGAFPTAANPVAVPAVTIASQLTDAIFEPLAARQNVARTRFAAAATANSVLLDVSTLYFELVGAEAALQLRRETESEAKEAARLTAAYAESGQGFVSDADRAATLSTLIHRAVEQSEEEVAVASARLSRRLHLDPVVRVHPVVPSVAPIALIDASSPVEELVRVALQGRPEMGDRAAAIGVAETRLNQEIARPCLPTVWLGFSGGVVGGGSNLVPPLVGNFASRTDFDVRLFWTLQNLGLGNLSLQKQRRAAIGQAMGEQSRTINMIRREVASSRALVLATRQRVDATRHQLETSEAGFRADLDRLRNTVGRPIELTNSLELLAQARIDHVRAIIDYNQAQLRLFVSLGSPPPLDRPATEPLPAAPVASPPLPLVPVR
ncbi:TolC family protein [Singulisphaera acidiphila]|uniref:TolC family protein n=1 Tax=Singulisphaera acidiphila TaxID=466153 RepID=UPI001ED928C9|nr:TolC family protein [Singulisphaera acidiphila]